MIFAGASFNPCSGKSIDSKEKIAVIMGLLLKFRFMEKDMADLKHFLVLREIKIKRLCFMLLEHLS